MNPFENPSFVEGYEAWYSTEGHQADKLEKDLIRNLIVSFPEARTVLDVGCGTGHFSRWCEFLGMQVSGLDLSMAMLQEACRLGDHPCLRGNALALPFGACTFDLVIMITTLEFIANPLIALSEMFQVARTGLILGVLNRKSRLGQRLRNEGGPIWSHARFFSPLELLNKVETAADWRKIKVFWRTTLWPVWPKALPLPWGGFIGMGVRIL